MKLFSHATAVLLFGFASSAFAEPYQGPINLALKVEAYDAGAQAYMPLENTHVFLNTVQFSPAGNKANQYLRTNSGGWAYITLSHLAVGAHLTLYGVRSSDSQIMLDCKLVLVPEDAKRYLIVPEVEGASYVDRTMQLRGSACRNLN